MNIRQALKNAKAELKKKYIQNPDLDARILMCKILNFNHEKLISELDNNITDENLKKFSELVERRKNKEPVAYIVGHKEFFGLNFIVDKHTLIPRPDSEVIIDYLTNTLNMNDKFHFADLGTGSGCLIITLLTFFKNSSALAIDIDNGAIEIAKQNAQNHHVADRLEFIQNDWFSGLDTEQKFDIIISNPPYITAKDYDDLADDVKKYEPKRALFAGIDGLDCFVKIISQSYDMLQNQGLLALEIGYNQVKFVEQILQQNNFVNVKFIKDLGNKIRYLIAEKIV